jgi:hypothetical protein
MLVAADGISQIANRSFFFLSSVKGSFCENDNNAEYNIMAKIVSFFIIVWVQVLHTTR